MIGWNSEWQHERYEAPLRLIFSAEKIDAMQHKKYYMVTYQNMYHWLVDLERKGRQRKIKSCSGSAL